MPPSVSGTSVSRSVSGLRACWRRRAPCRRFGALIASTMGKDKKRAPAPPAKKNDGDASGYGLPPEPSLASSAAMRAFKASFSSRASRAISLTASNSSRLTTSRSRTMRSAWLRNMVPSSRRTPEATPAASFISRAISSKKRLLVWVIAGLGFAFKAPAGTMVTVCSARKAGRDASVISGHCGSILPRSTPCPQSRAGRERLGELATRKSERLGIPALGRLTSRPRCPHHPGIQPANRPMPLYALPFPAFDPVLISFGPVAIRWYALAYIVGILLGWLYARAIIRRERFWGSPVPMTVTDYDDFVLWVTLGIILGGRIGYVLFYNPSYFAAHPLESLQLWKGGMSFHGGFLGCVLAVVLFARHRGLSILSLGDITCAAGTIGIFLGRIANFINGELWGRPTDLPWAMVFPTGGPLPRHPSQLYEAALEGLLLFVLLTALIRAGALKRPGFILGAFSFGYAVARSIGEHFREPDPQLGFLWGGLTMGTLLSLPLMLAGIALMAAAMRKETTRRTGRRLPRSRQRFDGASQSAARCRLRIIWSFASPTPSAVTTPGATRSASRATSPPPPRSARCSASSSACGRRRPGARWDRPARSIWSSSGPAAAP